MPSAAPLPVWSSSISPAGALAEPPVPSLPSTLLAVTQVTQGASQTVFSGKHSIGSGTVSDYGLTVFLHADVDYLQSDAVSMINADGTFAINVPRSIGNVSRAVIVLHLKTSDLMASPGCNAAAGYCVGWIDPVLKISFPVSRSLATAYTTAYFPLPAAASNPQILALQKMMSGFQVTGGAYGAGRLIRSFRDMNTAFLYDQALAVIAFSHAGDIANADLILNALAALQDASGAWMFSYMEDGSLAEPGVDKRIAGANAWMAIALNAYQQAFSSTKYLTMSRKLHDYLRTEITPVTINGSIHAGLRFAPTDYAPGRTKLFALEHQLDAYAAMLGFYQLNGGDNYLTAANQLRNMAESLWNGSRFLAGYDAVSNQFNTAERYLDTYSWSILALGNVGSMGQRFADSMTGICDFFTANGTLYYPSRKLTGVTGFFDRITNNVMPAESKKFVWSEGTYGAILAMRQIKAGGWNPVSCNGNTEESIRTAIEYMLDPLGGMPYATQNADADFTASASVAGTAWLYFTQKNLNPFKFTLTP